MDGAGRLFGGNQFLRANGRCRRDMKRIQRAQANPGCLRISPPNKVGAWFSPLHNALEKSLIESGFSRPPVVNRFGQDFKLTFR